MTLEELQRLREAASGIDPLASDEEAWETAAHEALSPTGCVSLMAAERDQFIADIATLERRNESLAAELQRFRHELERLGDELKCANALVVAKNNSYVSLQIESEKLTAERDALARGLEMRTQEALTFLSERDALKAELASADALLSDADYIHELDAANKRKAAGMGMHLAGEPLRAKKLEADNDRLRAELEEARRDRDHADACSSRDIEALAIVRAQLESLRAELASDDLAQLHKSKVAQLRELREAAERHVRVFDEFAEMVMPTPETAVYTTPLGEATEALRAVLASLQPSASDGLIVHKRPCPADDGEVCDCGAAKPEAAGGGVMEEQYNMTVNLRIERCWECGRWYGYEPARTARCPVCARAATDDLNARLEQSARTIAALKGAITKSKRREGF